MTFKYTNLYRTHDAGLIGIPDVSIKVELMNEPFSLNFPNTFLPVQCVLLPTGLTLVGLPYATLPVVHLFDGPVKFETDDYLVVTDPSVADPSFDKDAFFEMLLNDYPLVPVWNKRLKQLEAWDPIDLELDNPIRLEIIA